MPENMKSLNGYRFDAEKLNGKPGSEYASAESLRQLKDEKINYTDALTLEEIEASTDLTKKVVSASIFEYRSQELANGADYESVILENFNTLICRSGNVCTLSITVDANYNNSNDDWVYPFVLPDWATPKNSILFDTIARTRDAIKYWNFGILDDGRIRCYTSKDTAKWRVTLSFTYVV